MFDSSWIPNGGTIDVKYRKSTFLEHYANILYAFSFTPIIQLWTCKFISYILHNIHRRKSKSRYWALVATPGPFVTIVTCPEANQMAIASKAHISGYVAKSGAFQCTQMETDQIQMALYRCLWGRLKMMHRHQVIQCLICLAIIQK